MLTSVIRAICVLTFSLFALTTSRAQTPRSISVTGQAEVRVTPSMANIIFGVETLNKVLAVAKDENDKRVQAVVQSTQALGVASKDIQTDYIQVEPRCDDLSAGGSGDLLGETIALGQIGISASVSVSFELEPQ